MKEVAALRIKYRIKNDDGTPVPRKTIAPHLVAWHMKNRRGVKPNPNRVQQLVLSYCGGWDPDEADHQAVCVQINPDTDYGKELIDFNKVLHEDACFARATSTPEVAAASHSHLNLALHNVAHGAEISLSGLKDYCKQGKLSLELVGNVDPEMMAHAQRGLLWEVLSYKMEEEEPTAFDKLQSALNAKNNQALVEHEMEVLNGLMNVIRDTGAGLADQFNWRMVQSKLLGSGNTVVAESPEFLALCQVVFNALGGASAEEGCYNHWAELKHWHETIINPMTRKVRLQAIAKLAAVPVIFPRVRNALFRLAYSGKPFGKEAVRTGQVYMKCLGSLNHLEADEMTECLQLAEDVLQSWHHDYQVQGAYSHLEEKMVQQLWAQVDPRFVTPLARKGKKTAILKELKERGATEDAFIRRTIPRSTVAHLPLVITWDAPGKSDTSSSGGAAASPGGAAASPGGASSPGSLDKIKTGVDGKVQVSRSAVVAAPPEKVNICKLCSQQHAAVNIVKIRLAEAIWVAHRLLPAQPVQVIGVAAKADQKKFFQKTMVVAEKDLESQELCLLPLVKGLEAIAQQGYKAGALEVEMPHPWDASESIELLVLPITRYQEEGRFMPPFWCVERGDEQVANMTMQEIDVDYIQTLMVENTTAREVRKPENGTTKVTVPIMTNTKAITKGAELIIARPNPKSKIKPEKQATAWSNAQKEMKQKAQADAKSPNRKS